MLVKRWVLVGAMGLFTALVASCGSGSSGSTNAPVRPPATPAVTGKGEPNGTPTQATIGAGGGQLTSSDGMLTVIVPPGALTADTPIGIQPITNLAPGSLGASYRLTPEGQVFGSPAQLVFAFTDAELAGSALAALRVAYQDDKGQWRSLKSVTRDAAAHKLSVTTTHFSDWAQTTGLKLTPPSKSIQAGESVDLRLEICLYKDYEESSDELSDLVLTCEQSRESTLWAVNGVAGGDGESGTVSEIAPGDAKYVSPDIAPTRNRVAVSADVPQTDGSKILVVSNITVGGHPSWVGTSRTDTTLTDMNGVTKIVADASVRWTWDETDQAYHAIGALAIDYNLTTASCTTTAHFQGAIAGQDGTLVVFDSGSGQQQYSGTGYTNATVMGTSTCNATHTPEPALAFSGPTAWWTAPLPPANVSADGRTIAGSVVSPPGQMPSTDAQWSFTVE